MWLVCNIDALTIDYLHSMHKPKSLAIQSFKHGNAITVCNYGAVPHNSILLWNFYKPNIGSTEVSGISTHLLNAILIMY